MLEQINRIRPLFSRRDKILYVGLLAAMAVGAVLEVIGVGMIPAFVATLAAPEKVMAYPVAGDLLTAVGITDGQDLVIWGCVGLIVIFFLKNIYLGFLHYAQIRITEVHRVRLSRRLFAAYMRAPYEFYVSKNSAELLRNVDAETKEIIQGVVNPLLLTVMGVLMALGVVALLVAATPGIVLLSVAVVASSSAAFLRVFKKRLKTYGQVAKRERKESLKAINQGLGSFLDARVLGREEFFIEVFHRSLSRFAEVDRLRQFTGKLFSPVMECIAVIGLFIIVLVLSSAGMDAATMVPTLALFGAAIVQLRTSVSQVVTGVSQIQFSLAAIPNVVGDLQLLEKPSHQRKRRKKQAEAPRPALPFNEAIVLDRVTYTYPGVERPALEEVSLVIEKGASVAFVGSTGSGKSTLVNLLLGFLKPQQGTVTVDGADIYTNLRGWHRNVGYIPQTIFLLDDTIRRNIAFGIPDEEIDEEQLWTAIRAAQLEDFINSLEQGLDTIVGERGMRISGGQRQRIGLARALYHNPDVLIMDEATSALDNQTENLVMEALNELKEGRTFIMIAHRLSTVRKCDRLYFLRNGRIDAEGTYEELSLVHSDFRQMAEVA